jgi:drug/metabolite transporter superfamily protein YnfA
LARQKLDRYALRSARNGYRADLFAAPLTFVDSAAAGLAYGAYGGICMAS